MRRQTERDRFWSKVNADHGTGACWIWMGHTRRGYGQFQGAWANSRQRKYQAHRYAWEDLIGPIEPGLELDHRVCRNKLCVNPDHLVPCTHAEHMKQPDSGGRYSLLKSHCNNGHERNDTNTWIDRHGHTQCRVCARMRMRMMRKRRSSQN
jgi:hypothetical protein